MQRRDSRALRNVHLALDCIVTVLAIALAAALHRRLQALMPALRGLPHFSDYALLAYTMVPMWLLLIVVFELHLSLERRFRPGELLLKLVKLHVAGLFALSAFQFLTQSVINRSFVLLLLSCTFVLMYVQRVVLGGWVRLQYTHGSRREQVLLVGLPCQRMADFVRDARGQSLPPEILGYLSPPFGGNGLSIPPAGEVAPPHIGRLDELERLLHQRAIDHVMFFPPANRPEEVRDALASCEALGVPASFSVNLVQIARATPRITSVYDHPFVTFDVAPKRPEWLALKYGLDPILAAAALLLLSPVLLLAALTVLVTMGRPVFFIQQRAGLYGRPFKMLKLRSMTTDAEQRRAELEDINQMSGPVFKAENDPRITKVGGFLRRTSLDELPQLLNVISGSMSMVGPRPLPTAEQEQIRGWQRRRLSMKPGITGLWQVSGRSGRDFEEWMLLDLQYIDEWSLLLDLTLLLRTLPAVLLGRGAR